MWTFESEDLPRNRGHRVRVRRVGKPATFSDVVLAWREDPAFRAAFNSLLAGMPFTAFRWETPPVRETTVDRAFEFVVLDDPKLNHEPNPKAFSGHLTDVSSGIVEFANLGGDAILVVPCPEIDHSCHGHLAAFVRGAPESQRDALWQAVGKAMQRRIGERPVWLNTAGAGVPWLHVRLDDRPKYYHFREYAREP